MSNITRLKRLSIAVASVAVFASAPQLALAAYGDATAAENYGRSGTFEGVRNLGGDEIILQGFHWNTVKNKSSGGKWYGEMKNHAADITGLGATMVWMPPPWDDSSSWADNGKSGGKEGYFWGSFDSVYPGGSSAYGSESDLYTTVNNLDGAGIKVIYDIVANHRNKGAQGSRNYFYSGDKVSPQKQKPAEGGSKWGPDDGDYFTSGDADVALPRAREDYKVQMQRLVDNYKAAGYRWDFVKGFDASHVAWLLDQTKRDGFCVGELWAEWALEPGPLNTWAENAHCAIFDFAMKKQLVTGEIGNLQYSMNASSDAWKRARAVTFVTNHDTDWSPNTPWGQGGQSLWPTPDGSGNNADFKLKAYTYILTSPGTPTIYLPDAFSDSFAGGWAYNLIHDAIAARKNADVRAHAPISIKGAGGGVLRYVVQGNAKRVAVYIGNGANNKSVTDVDSSLTGTWTAWPNNSYAGSNGANFTFAKVWTEGSGSSPTPDVPSDNFATMFVRGTNNAWGATAMSRVDETSGTNWTGTEWVADVIFGSAASQLFKFEVGGGAVWSTNFGDNATVNGIADTGTDTNNIPVTGGAGTYRIVFNDVSKYYTVTKKSAPPVNTAPIANAGLDISVKAGTSFVLDGSKSTDADGNTLTLSWACASNCTGWSGTGATQTLTNAGTYTATLTVSDGTLSSTDTAIITVAAAGPTSKKASMYLRGTCNNFAAQKMTLIADYTWSGQCTFGSATDERFKLDVSGTWTAGTTANTGIYGIDTVNAGKVLNGGGDIYLTKVGSGAGDYTITMNDNTLAMTVTKTSTPPVNMSPTANAGPDVAVKVGDTVTFIGGGSSDPDGSISTYSWTSSAWSGSKTGASPTNTFGTAGTYTVTLTVTDNGGATNVDTMIVTVSNPSNTAPSSVSATSSSYSITAGDTVTYTGSATDAEQASNTLVYTWSTGEIGSSVSHVFSTAGTYVVTLTVKDSGGLTTAASMTITVAAPNIPTPPTPPTLTGKAWKVLVPGLSRGLEVPSGGAPGTKVAIWDIGGTPQNHQQWEFISNGTGHFQIRAKHNTNSCLEAPSNTTAEGAQIGTWCHTGNHNYWDAIYLGNNLWQFKLKSNGKYLRRAGAATANGTKGLQSGTIDGAATWNLVCYSGC